MSGTIHLQDGDDLDEQTLGEALRASNQTDYVVQGLDLTADFQNLELDVASGKARVLDGDRVYHLDVDAVTKSLSDNQTHDVFVRFDPATDDDVSVSVITDGSTPSDSHLLIGTVDTNAAETTETNRNPDAEFESLSTAESVIGRVNMDDMVRIRYRQNNDVALNSSGFTTLPIENIQNDSGATLDQTNDTFTVPENRGIRIESHARFDVSAGDIIGMQLYNVDAGGGLIQDFREAWETGDRNYVRLTGQRTLIGGDNYKVRVIGQTGGTCVSGGISTQVNISEVMIGGQNKPIR